VAGPAKGQRPSGERESGRLEKRSGPRLGRLGWKRKGKGNPLKMISRFRKMNKEIRVIEMIGKNPKNSQKIIENMGRLECELE
jgi:predicted transcriptional regulator